MEECSGYMEKIDIIRYCGLAGSQLQGSREARQVRCQNVFNYKSAKQRKVRVKTKLMKVQTSLSQSYKTKQSENPPARLGQGQQTKTTN